MNIMLNQAQRYPIHRCIVYQRPEIQSFNSRYLPSGHLIERSS